MKRESWYECITGADQGLVIGETDGNINEGKCMNRIDILWYFDFPDTEPRAEGYDVTRVPEATTDNMICLVDKLNDTIALINELTDIIEEMRGEK